MREEGGKADNATNPTDSIELSLTVVPRSSRSRETIRLSPSLSLPLPLPLPPRFLSPRVETGPSRFDSLRGVESGEGVASPRISVDRKRWRNREGGGDATRSLPSPRGGRCTRPSLLTFALWDACFCGGTGRLLGRARERGPPARRVGGR